MNAECKREEVFCNWKVVAIFIGVLVSIGVIICLAGGNESENWTKSKESRLGRTGKSEEDGRDQILPERIEIKKVEPKKG